jgi:hypothetical protein
MQDYARTDRNMLNMLELVGTGGICRIGMDRQVHTGIYMNMLEQPE